MSLSAKLRRAPARIVTGAFILNSGLGKLKGNDETAKAIHGMAAGAYPALEKVPPNPFLKTLAVSEIVLGSALLVPFAPAALTGLGLAGFSASLLGVYWRTPGMHEEGSIRPTQQGIPIAKDVWMLGIATSLVLDSVLEPVHDKRVELTHDAKASTARRAVKAASAAKLARAKAEARAAKVARKAAKQARAARRASRQAFDKVTP
ncbi:MAG: hypothetical protein QOF87_4874 [Pseudonocardiales bacterium]|jgi:uncharacterized membrane protein YphA (DoxX/SURF4 family)|nr:hypothetical protein [Pseudonocardiales bacterium]